MPFTSKAPGSIISMSREHQVYKNFLRLQFTDFLQARALVKIV
jgi:hypothetical protein